MSVIDTLVTDRTLADVQRANELAAIGYRNMTAEQKAEWDGPLKGRYDIATDLNRVSAACAYLYELFTGGEKKCLLSTTQRSR